MDFGRLSQLWTLKLIKHGKLMVNDGLARYEKRKQLKERRITNLDEYESITCCKVEIMCKRNSNDWACQFGI